MLLNCSAEKTLKISWTARRSNQSILKEISPGCSLEGLMLKLKLFNTLATWREELTHLKRPWCWGRLKAGEGDNRGWDGWMTSLTWWTWVWVSSGSWWWTEKPGVLQSMGSQSWTWLSDWTEDKMWKSGKERSFFFQSSSLSYQLRNGYIQLWYILKCNLYSS